MSEASPEFRSAPPSSPASRVLGMAGPNPSSGLRFSGFSGAVPPATTEPMLNPIAALLIEVLEHLQMGRDRRGDRELAGRLQCHQLPQQFRPQRAANFVCPDRAGVPSHPQDHPAHRWAGPVAPHRLRHHLVPAILASSGRPSATGFDRCRHLIDGKASAAKLREKIAAYTAELKSRHGLQPGLATVLVGKDPASEVYVRNKRKTAEAIGFKSVHVELPETVSQDELLAQVKALSADPFRAWHFGATALAQASGRECGAGCAGPGQGCRCPDARRMPGCYCRAAPIW